MERAARALVEAGARAALIKGGHLSGTELVDVLYDGTELRTYRRARLSTRNTHGTGCTLSAAVAAGLARGTGLAGAVENALDFVQRAMASAPNLGRGNGPLNHFLTVPVFADR
jgi:hydroxymethylpyrimidine/phosphomethylpyrimidine kinase